MLKNKYLKYDARISLEIFEDIVKVLAENGWKFNKSIYGDIKDLYAEFISSEYLIYGPMEYMYGIYSTGEIDVDDTEITVQDILGYNPFAEKEFVLPEKWYIEVGDNSEVINKWKFTTQWTEDSAKYKYVDSDGCGSNIHNWHSVAGSMVYVKITFEQFKKYVLKEQEEQIEVKVEFDDKNWQIKTTQEVIDKIQQYDILLTKGYNYTKNAYYGLKNGKKFGNIAKVPHIRLITLEELNKYVLSKLESPKTKNVMNLNDYIVRIWPSGTMTMGCKSGIFFKSLETYNHEGRVIYDGTYGPWDSNKPYTQRQATQDELNYFLEHKTLTTYRLPIEDLLIEAKKKYPLFCTYQSTESTNQYTRNHELVVRKNGYNILDGTTCHLYYKNKWADVIKLPQYVECIKKDAGLEVGKIYKINHSKGYLYSRHNYEVFYLEENGNSPYTQTYFTLSDEYAYNKQNQKPSKYEPSTKEDCDCQETAHIDLLKSVIDMDKFYIKCNSEEEVEELERFYLRLGFIRDFTLGFVKDKWCCFIVDVNGRNFTPNVQLSTIGVPEVKYSDIIHSNILKLDDIITLDGFDYEVKEYPERGFYLRCTSGKDNNDKVFDDYGINKKSFFEKIFPDESCSGAFPFCSSLNNLRIFIDAIKFEIQSRKTGSDTAKEFQELNNKDNMIIDDTDKKCEFIVGDWVYHKNNKSTYHITEIDESGKYFKAEFGPHYNTFRLALSYCVLANTSQIQDALAKYYRENGISLKSPDAPSNDCVKVKTISNEADDLLSLLTIPKI